MNIAIMERLLYLAILSAFTCSGLYAQDSGLPGEDFDLNALAGIIETVET
jgi:hypothetical protein